MVYYVYILYSYIKNRYYIGSTSDVEERLKRHNAGATLSTKSGKPWKVVYTKQFDSNTEALKYENFIKRMKNRKKYTSGFRTKGVLFLRKYNIACGFAADKYSAVH